MCSTTSGTGTKKPFNLAPKPKRGPQPWQAFGKLYFKGELKESIKKEYNDYLAAPISPGTKKKGTFEFRNERI